MGIKQTRPVSCSTKPGKADTSAIPVSGNERQSRSRYTSLASCNISVQYLIGCCDSNPVSEPKLGMGRTLDTLPFFARFGHCRSADTCSIGALHLHTLEAIRQPTEQARSSRQTAIKIKTAGNIVCPPRMVPCLHSQRQPPLLPELWQW